MLLMRVAGMFTAIVVAAGIVSYLFTRDRRYLLFAGRVAKWALAFVLLVLGLMFLERVIVL